MVQILKVLSLVKHHNWNQVGLITCQLQGVHAIATHWSTPPSSVPSEASLVLTLSLSLTHTVTFSPGRPTETKPAAAGPGIGTHALQATSLLSSVHHLHMAYHYQFTMIPSPRVLVLLPSFNSFPFHKSIGAREGLLQYLPAHTVLPLSRASYICLSLASHATSSRLHTNALHCHSRCCLYVFHACIGVLQRLWALADLVAVRAASWVPADRQPISCAFYSPITNGHA